MSPMSCSNDQVPQDGPTTATAPRPASASPSSLSAAADETSTGEDVALTLKAACETALPEDSDDGSESDESSDDDLSSSEFDTEDDEELEQLEQLMEEERKELAEQHLKLHRKIELDEVMVDIAKMVGIDQVKQLFSALKSRVEVSQALGLNDKRERFHAVLLGNRGTGKTTIAMLYARLLRSLGILGTSRDVSIGVIQGGNFDPQDAASVKSFTGAPNCGHVLIWEDPHKFGYKYNDLRQEVRLVDMMLTRMDGRDTPFVVVFTGEKADLEPFFSRNMGLSHRFPYTLELSDFSEQHLHATMLGLVEEVYGGRCEIEGGQDGPHMRTAIRRLARARGIRGFGNGTAVEGLLAQIRQRQSRRLLHERQLGPEDSNLEAWLRFTKEDMVGPCPSVVRQSSQAWAELRAMSGLDQVKAAVESLFDLAEENYQRELTGKTPLAISLNRIFLGSPGTGKTTIARLYAKVLVDLGLLSSGGFVLKTPSDFLGAFPGESQRRTKEILALTIGKALVIDEAYVLDPGHMPQNRNPNATTVLDTIVSEVQGYPGEDRCIILLGYPDPMRSLFQNGNPGLSGRFMADRPLFFPDFTMEELREIMKAHLEREKIHCGEGAIDAAMGVLARAKNARHFSNGREVKNLVTAAIPRYLARQRGLGLTTHDSDFILAPEDFDPRFKPGDSTMRTPDCRRLLEGKVAESVIKQLEQYLQPGVKGYGRLARSRLVPRTFVLKGPSGAGKSTVTRQMGVFFYHSGLLSTQDVVECQGSDLVGQYVGQTTLTCRSRLERGIGKVLVINDIHALSARHRSGSYSNEAITEVVSFIRKHSERMVTILNGPSGETDAFMSERPDLAALFRSEVTFGDLSPSESLVLLTQRLGAAGVVCPSLETPDVRRNFHKGIEVLSAFPCWSNVGDIEHLVQDTMKRIGEEMWTAGKFRDDLLCLPEDILMDSIKAMFRTKTDRSRMRKVEVAKEKSEARALLKELILGS